MSPFKVWLVGIAFVALVSGSASWSQEPSSVSGSSTKELPAWAYVSAQFPGGRGPGPQPGNGDLAEVVHLAGSDKKYTRASLDDLFGSLDWFPDIHPSMPEVVAQGRKPHVWACAYCHLPNGLSRPENESVAGLPAAYIVAQVHDFKTGVRRSSDAQSIAEDGMINVSEAVSDDDLDLAAQYYASIKPGPSRRIVETDSVPQTKVVAFMLQAVDGPREPIGDRIIELPEDRGRTELHDPTSGFVDYVPKGSLSKGKELVASGGGTTIACTTCHGPDLRGVGNIPSIAGRSPVQMTRQMIDFETGARHGTNAQLMKPVVSKMSIGDIVNAVAYLASLEP